MPEFPARVAHASSVLDSASCGNELFRATTQSRLSQAKSVSVGYRNQHAGSVRYPDRFVATR